MWEPWTPIASPTIGACGVGRPWALLTASGLCWLAADFTSLAFVHLTNDQIGPLYDIFRLPACLFVMTAGIAQRWVIDARELEGAIVKGR